MKILKLNFTCGLVVLSLTLSAQSFEANEKFSFGRLNPESPEQLKDYQQLIGLYDCTSIRRTASNNWGDTVRMEWKFKYIMDGLAVQDETLKENGIHSGSIRQYNPDSARWYVHYYSSSIATPKLKVWEGNLNEQGEILLYSPQKRPDGVMGFYKITFSNIREEGFNWQGEWVDKAETISFPIWKIFCKTSEK